MHIALLSAEYPPMPGGVGDYTRWLGEALARREYRVVVLTGTAPGLSPAQAAGPPVRRLPITAWDWRCWRAVIAALDELRPQILHLQYQTGAYGMHPAINLLPWRLRQLPERPRIVVTAHDLLVPYLFPKAGPLRRWVTRRLLADADAVVLTNPEDFASVVSERSGIGARRPTAHLQSLTSDLQAPALIPIGSNIPVAPPAGYERAGWRARLGIGADEIVIAFFGLLSRNKGVDVLLRALARLPERFRLLIIGGEATAPQDRAYAAEVRALIEAPDLRWRVIITGQCSAAEVSAHLLAAELAALPFIDGASFRRGSLLAVLAHGVPLVTTMGAGSAIVQPPYNQTDCPLPSVELPQLVDGKNVLLAPPGDAIALADAIARLAADAALRARLRDSGQELAAHFSWDTIAARHEALYRTLKERPG
jgi:glycosyltransferase involved in cell wall biosynthesis